MIDKSVFEDHPLQLLVSQIIELVHPKKIYLFGSRATGKFHETSDYDLLIIIDDGMHRRKTAQILYEKIVNVIVPYDLIVTTEDSLSKNLKNPGLIYSTAMQNCIELYAA